MPGICWYPAKCAAPPGREARWRRERLYARPWQFGPGRAFLRPSRKAAWPPHRRPEAEAQPQGDRRRPRQAQDVHESPADGRGGVPPAKRGPHRARAGSTPAPPPSSRAARARTSSVRAGAVMVTSGSPHAGSMRTTTFIFEPSPLHPQYRQKPAACLQICDRRPVFRDNWRGGRSKKARGGQLRGRAYRRTPAPGSSGSSRRATFR